MGNEITVKVGELRRWPYGSIFKVRFVHLNPVGVDDVSGDALSMETGIITRGCTATAGGGTDNSLGGIISDNTKKKLRKEARERGFSLEAYRFLGGRVSRQMKSERTCELYDLIDEVVSIASVIDTHLERSFLHITSDTLKLDNLTLHMRDLARVAKKVRDIISE